MKTPPEDFGRNSLNLSRDSNIKVEQLRNNDLGTSLIPDDVFGRSGSIALKSTGNGDSLFNSASLLLSGDESLSDLLGILVAGELYFHADFYANHKAFRKAKKNVTGASKMSIFSPGADQCLLNTGR